MAAEEPVAVEEPVAAVAEPAMPEEAGVPAVPDEPAAEASPAPDLAAAAAEVLAAAMPWVELGAVHAVGQRTLFRGAWMAHAARARAMRLRAEAADAHRLAGAALTVPPGALVAVEAEDTGTPVVAFVDLEQGVVLALTEEVEVALAVR